MNRKFGNIVVRDAHERDTLSVIRVHFDSVHYVASKDYPIEILDEWSPPVSEERIKKFLSNGADVKLVAELNGDIVGFGELLTKKNQLGAVYVSSSAIGQGIGRTIVMCLEEIAKQKGVPFLQMESSVTASPFYQKIGYQVLAHGVHVLDSGQTMSCVKMRKDFLV